MVSGYFGVPGCGKSTLLTMFAQKELKRIEKGKSNYKYIYTNFSVDGCLKFDLKDLGRYHFHDALILIDEITLDADSRDYKWFPKQLKKFFTLHRHCNCDIKYFCQDYERCDKTIRNVTYDLWAVSRSVVPFFKRFCIARRIFRNLNINEYTSELVIGYRFSKFTERLFSSTCKICYMPHWWPFFDSYEKYGFDSLPEPAFIFWGEDNLNSPESSPPGPTKVCPAASLNSSH